MQNKYGYVFTDEYYEKEEEINMKAAELEALITEHNRRQKEDGIDYEKNDSCPGCSAGYDNSSSFVNDGMW